MPANDEELNANTGSAVPEAETSAVETAAAQLSAASTVPLNASPSSAADPSQSITTVKLAPISSPWINAFTHMHRIPVFKRVWLYLFLMACYTVVVDKIADATFPSSMIKEAGAAAYGSVVLGLLLVFRTNQANERWVEGRKLWGQLVNESRNLTLKVRSFINVPDEEKFKMGELVISFAYALKHHLRGTNPSEPLPGIGKPSPSDIKHLPVLVTSKIFDLLQQWRKAGFIDTSFLIQMEFQIKIFMDVCGACERIKNSPLAVSYRAFMRQGIVLNLLAYPWYITPQYSVLWCLPLILIGTYFLIGLEMIAEDVEEPFGRDGDDLPLDAICATIRNSVSDILGLQKKLRFTRSSEAVKGDPLKQ
jgi:ion channel-forming bestrophin family protein